MRESTQGRAPQQLPQPDACGDSPSAMHASILSSPPPPLQASQHFPFHCLEAKNPLCRGDKMPHLSQMDTHTHTQRESKRVPTFWQNPLTGLDWASVVVPKRTATKALPIPERFFLLERDRVKAAQIQANSLDLLARRGAGAHLSPGTPSARAHFGSHVDLGEREEQQEGKFILCTHKNAQGAFSSPRNTLR